MNRLILWVMMAVSQAAIAGDAPISRELKLEFDELAAKATATIATVNGMERRANEQGLSLHPDVLLQRDLVQSSMDEAEEALRLKDNRALPERLNRARAYIARLAKML